MPEKKERPQDRYDRKNTKTYGVKVVITTEREVYEKLENTSNKSGYVKALIRADIEKNKKSSNSV